MDQTTGVTDDAHSAPADGSADALSKNVERAVAYAALRRMSKLAAADNAEERTKARWARRLSLAFAAIVVATLIVGFAAPGLLRALLRGVAGVIR